MQRVIKKMEATENKFVPYHEAKKWDYKGFEVFFAFSDSQFEKGKIEAGIKENQKILRGFAGMFGTKEGLADYMKKLEEHDNFVTENCNPQEVYNYEYHNHECGYTNDDEEAMILTISTFGIEKAKLIKRKNAYLSLESILENMKKSNY